MGWVAVITNAGNTMIGQISGGLHTLTLTKATVGSGSVPEANMRIATALNNEKMDASIAECVDTSTGVKLRIRVSPATALVGAYTAHEIGVWGKLDNGAETLVALAQDAVDGIAVPLASASPEFVFDLFIPIVCSNTSALSVTIDTLVYVSNGQWITKNAKDKLMAEGIDNCTATPTVDGNGDITGMTHVDVDTSQTIRTDAYTRSSTQIVEVRTLNTGEVLTITTDLTTKTTSYIYS